MPKNTASLWLVIKEQDTVKMAIAMKTIKFVYKHFVEARGRSYLCFGENCTWCKDGYEQRLRYQADIIVDGARKMWEFGDDVMGRISGMEQEEGFLKISVTRLGVGRKTGYQVDYIDQSKYKISSNNTLQLPVQSRDIWISVLKKLRDQVSNSNFETWLNGTRGIGCDYTNMMFIVGVPSVFVADWLNNRLHSLIKRAISEVIGKKIDVTYKVMTMSDSDIPSGVSFH